MARPTDPRTKKGYERRKPRPDHMWKPGTSGNPGGRPKKVKELAEKAGRYTDVVFAQFEDMLKNPNTKDETRMAICRELLDRGFGRPAQSLAIHGDDDKPPILTAETVLTPEQFKQVIAAGRQLDDDV